MTKDEIIKKYGVPSYRAWKDVPDNLCSRTELLRKGISIPKNTKPDGIKNSSCAISKDRIYFLFDINKYK